MNNQNQNSPHQPVNSPVLEPSQQPVTPQYDKPPLPPDELLQPTTSTNSLATLNPPKGSKKSNIYIVGTVLLIVVVGALIFLQKAKDDKNNASKTLNSSNSASQTTGSEDQGSNSVNTNSQNANTQVNSDLKSCDSSAITAEIAC